MITRTCSETGCGDLFSGQHRALWERARPFLQVRENELHSALTYSFSRRLAAGEGVVDQEGFVLAAMLHDVGWSQVPEHLVLESFGPECRFPELRRLHETEGVRIARELLHDEVQEDRIGAILALIDGHDTLQEPRSPEQGLLREADKLWCYTGAGFDIVRRWFSHTPSEHLKYLEEWLTERFTSPTGSAMAQGCFAALEAELKAW